MAALMATVDINPFHLDIFQSTSRELIVYGGRGAGKCFERGTEIVKPGGSLIPVEQITIGDNILGSNGTVQSVIAVHRGVADLYRIEQSKAQSYVVNGSHELVLKKRQATSKPYLYHNRGRYPDRPEVMTISVENYIKQSNKFKAYYKPFKTTAVFKSAHIDIDPYFLGLWLGDGNTGKVAITTEDSEIKDYVYKTADEYGLKVTINQNTCKTCPTYVITAGNIAGYGRHKNRLLSAFKSYGLIGRKHIPNEYLINSEDVRLKLLAGIIDTDGCKSKNAYEIIQKSKLLIEQIKSLANSLGFYTYQSEKICKINNIGFSGLYHRLTISGDVSKIPVKLARKKTNGSCGYANQIKITPVSFGEYYGFTLDGDGTCYLKDYTVVHNSFSIAQKIVLLPSVHFQLGIDKPLKVMALRKTLPSLKASSMELIANEAERLGLRYELNRQDSIARIGKMQILFRSINNQDDAAKLRSVTDLDFAWMEELTEFREADYDEVLMILRGGHGAYKQVVGSFNPVGKTSWVFKRFFEQNIGNAQKLKYTIDHNPFLMKSDPAYIMQLDRLKEYDPNLWNIYRNGEWGELSGVIYNWDITDEPQSFDETFYGIDFGYSVDPCSLVKIYRKADEYWIKELIHQTGLTNIDLANRMIALGINRNDVIYADSAEPKSIDEIFSFGFNVQPCQKGADSIRAGIDFIKSQRVHIIDGSENVIREQKSYVWKKDKDGNPLNEPIGINNHAMDSIRYAIHTHMKDNKKPQIFVF